MGNELSDAQKELVRQRPRVGHTLQFWGNFIAAVWITFQAVLWFPDKIQDDFRLAFGQTAPASATVTRLWHPVKEINPFEYTYHVDGHEYVGSGYPEGASRAVGDTVRIVYCLSEPAISKVDGISRHLYATYGVIFLVLAIVGWWVLVFSVWIDVRFRENPSLYLFGNLGQAPQEEA